MILFVTYIYFKSQMIYIIHDDVLYYHYYDFIMYIDHSGRV